MIRLNYYIRRRAGLTVEEFEQAWHEHGRLWAQYAEDLGLRRYVQVCDRPDHPVAQALLQAVGEPMMTTTLRLPGDEFALTDPEDIRSSLEHQLDLIVNGGWGGIELTTVVDLTDGVEVVREGLGVFEG